MSGCWQTAGLVVLWSLTVGIHGHGCEPEDIGPVPSCGTHDCREGFVCTEGFKCEPLRQLNDACRAGRCVQPLRCDIGLDTPRCVEPGAVGIGGECAARADCADGLVCHHSRRCGSPAPEGTPCVDYRSVCREGHLCRADLDGTDRCLPSAEEGEPCVSNIGCRDGLICVGARGDRTCITPRAAGEMCRLQTDCAEGLRCVRDDDDARCAPPARLGEACDLDAFRLCAGRLQCDAGVCRISVEGEPCLTDDECRADLFCFGGGEHPACAHRPAD